MAATAPYARRNVEGVFTENKSALAEYLLHTYNRNGFLEERYYSLSFNPIVLDSGETGGCFTFVHDTTDRVIGERRLRTLRELVAPSMEAKEIDEVCKIAAEVMNDNRHDWPFALFYVPDEDLKRARLFGD